MFSKDKLKSKSQPKPAQKGIDCWRVVTAATNTHAFVYLVNDFYMSGPNGEVFADKAAQFGSVAHIDDDFEEKWAKLLSEARRRIEVLNMRENFNLEAASQMLSICGNCEAKFEGEDYLCPNCKRL